MEPLEFMRGRSLAPSVVNLITLPQYISACNRDSTEP